MKKTFLSTLALAAIASSTFATSYTPLTVQRADTSGTANYAVASGTAASLSGTTTLAHISDAGTAAGKNVGTTPGTVAAGDAPGIALGATALQPTGDIASTSGVNPTTQTALDARATKRVYKTASFTAVAYGRYHTSGTLTVTDPLSPIAGDIFDVVIVSGTATIGGGGILPEPIPPSSGNTTEHRGSPLHQR